MPGFGLGSQPLVVVRGVELSHGHRRRLERLDKKRQADKIYKKKNASNKQLRFVFFIVGFFLWLVAALCLAKLLHHLYSVS